MHLKPACGPNGFYERQTWKQSPHDFFGLSIDSIMVGDGMELHKGRGGGVSYNDSIAHDLES